MEHIPEGRAATDTQKHDRLLEISQAWSEVPTQRLGQLIVNAIGDRDLFYVEDEDLTVLLLKFAAKYA